jgi:uncharacterized protein YkwD
MNNLSDSDWDDRMRETINKMRKSEGLEPFLKHSSLVHSAQGQAEDNAKRDTLDHYGIDGSNWAERCKRAGYPGASLQNIGEDAAEGQDSCEELLRDWMNSPGHRRPLVSPNYRHIGNGKAISKSGHPYYCTDFGGGAPDEIEELARKDFDFL